MSHIVGVLGDVRLTGRELEVVGLLSEGLTATAIARKLGITFRTVSKHQERLYRKLGASDRLTAVLRAQELGLVAGPGRRSAAEPPCRHTVR